MTKDEKTKLENLELQALLDAIQRVGADITQQMLNVNARFSQLSKTDTEFKTELEGMRKDIQNNKIARLELDIEEGQRELELLEERKKKLTETLNLKKSSAAGTLDTGERMRAAARETIEEEERAKQEENAKWWRETWRGIGRAVLSALAVSLAFGVIGFIYWLILLRAGVSVP